MPRKRKVPVVGTDEVVIAKNVPNVSGTPLKGLRCRVVRQYESESKGGEEHALVQVAETGAVLGIPTKALRTRKIRTRSSSLYRSGWDRLFGRHR